MDYQSWIDNIEGWASLYSFDILPDGSFSEIRLMAYNRQNVVMCNLPPDAPAFYPGIPYRTYFTDLNFESYVYKSASTHQPLYSYVNVRGGWLKGVYLPVSEPGTASAELLAAPSASDEVKTVFCLYTATFSPEVESDSMTRDGSSGVAGTVMNISIKLHETQDFYQSMAAAAKEMTEVCGARFCTLYTVDKNSRKCAFINEHGVQPQMLEQFAEELQRSPYEIAMRWEEDLAMSDCLILDDLNVVRERDPLWYDSLLKHEIKNIILYAVRYNQRLVGFIWAANYDSANMIRIKETLEIASFIIAAVIANYQLLLRLEEKSTIDALTQVNNRNAMNERVDALLSGADELPPAMGLAFADLNGLKTMNDVEGHDAGDKLLVRAAALLKIAFGDHEIYRAGGDEFVVFCPDITEKALDDHVTELRALADSTPDVSFAVGTAYCTGKYDISRAMQTADENMYRDKEEYYRRNPNKARRKRS